MPVALPVSFLVVLARIYATWLTASAPAAYVAMVAATVFAAVAALRHAHHEAGIDIDHFKDLNDRYGHPVGDACLRAAARALVAAADRSLYEAKCAGRNRLGDASA